MPPLLTSNLTRNAQFNLKFNLKNGRKHADYCGKMLCNSEK